MSPAGQAGLPGAGDGRRSRRVLVAEDSLLNQEVAAGMLRLLGYEVDLVQDGDEAVQAVHGQAYGLVLMDCHMPGMDGFAAARAIREWEAGQPARIPIVALTADSSEGIREQCLLAGMDAYIAKPFTREALGQVLQTWLPGREPGSADDIPRSAGGEGDRWPSETALVGFEQTGRAETGPGGQRFGQMASLLREEAPKLLDKLERAAQRDDFDAVRLAAQMLKTSCAHIGAAHLSERAARLEYLAGEGDNAGVQKSLPGLRRDMQRFMAALTDSSGWEPSSNEVGNVAAAMPGQTLLLVDDDPAFRQATVEALQAEGFRVKTADDGLAALDETQRARPDLVLIDAFTGEMDGFEVCERLKRDDRTADIPVLMMIGREDAETAQRAFTAGAAGFTSKPLSYPILAQRIRMLLRAGQTEKALMERQLQLESAQRLAHLGYWRWDPQQGIFEISKQLAGMCGRDSADRLSGYRDFLVHVSPNDRERVELVLENARRGLAEQATDFHLTKATGERVHVQQAIEVQQGSNGEKVLLGVVQDVTHIRAMEDQLRSLAFYDSLTGLPNRVLFFSRLEEILSSARRHDEQVSLLFLDLDSFKDVNDSLGHDVGDQLLKEIARRLEESIRDEDLVVRLGGDEFCILATDNKDGLDAVEVAARCIARINEPVELKHQRVRPQASIGIARFPEDSDTPTGLLKAADSAMYAAKEAGKNRYAYYQVEMTQAAEQRLALEQEVRNAIQNREFVLHYQPQVRLDTGHCSGVEALVRWQHPARGIVAPDEFIPMVERMGLINELGQWVMEEACRQMGRWTLAGHTDLKIAVNFSPRQLADVTLQTQLLNALEASGIAPERFQIEVTESAVQEGRELIQVLHDLRGMGVKIAIDDFGTGYSALGSLKNMPIDTLKIDRSFIRDMLRDKHDTIVLGTIVGLAHAMQYCLVAEGAEDLDQVKVLHALGVDIVQGYYLSVPMPAEVLTPLLGEDFHALSSARGDATETAATP